MSKLCLFCGKPLEDESLEWHKSCIKKMFGTTQMPELNIDEEKIIDENIGQGKTVTGVQKKFSLDINVKQLRKTFSTNNSEFIVKTPQENLKNIVLFEWIGMKLAKICGIETVDCGVVKHKDDYLYITKRIDRKDNKKIPMEDFCQLSNTQTEYKYNGSYEKCYKDVIQKYSYFETLDKARFYKLMLFSYIIGNTDMHLKNFSLYELDNKYQLTPAYDLVPVLMVFNQQEMALSLNGKKTKLTKNDFKEFGEYMGLEKRVIFYLNDEILGKKQEFLNFIKETPLDKNSKEKFINLIEERMKIFA